MGDDELTNGVDVEIDRYYGAYFRGQFPNTMPVRPYGLIGLTYMETTEENRFGSSDGENYKDISLGLGWMSPSPTTCSSASNTCGLSTAVAMKSPTSGWA